MALSICIPTYNRLPHLKTTIKSIRESIGNYPYEIIIADGGSTDGTIEYLKEQDNIVLIEQGKLTGSIKAFNVCFKKTKYEYVFWASDDFIIFANVLVKCCKLMDKYPDIGMVSPKFIESKKYRFPNIGIWKKKLILSKTHIFRKNLLEEIRYFDENYRTYYIDIDSHLSILELGYTTIYTREIGVLHLRIHDETRKSNILGEKHVKKEFEYFEKKWEHIDKNLKISIFNRFKVKLFWSIQNKIRKSFLKNKMEAEKSFIIWLFDWILQKCIVFKNNKYNDLDDFYLAQKLPDNIINKNKFEK